MLVVKLSTLPHSISSDIDVCRISWAMRQREHCEIDLESADIELVRPLNSFHLFLTIYDPSLRQSFPLRYIYSFFSGAVQQAQICTAVSHFRRLYIPGSDSPLRRCRSKVKSRKRSGPTRCWHDSYLPHTLISSPLNASPISIRNSAHLCEGGLKCHDQDSKEQAHHDV